MSETRRHFTPEQKAEIVRRHLAGKEAVSALADDPAVYYAGHEWYGGDITNTTIGF